MSYNGNGTFQINTTGQPVVTGTVISSTAFNALTADLATGLSTAITKDGQTATTVRIPFAAGISSTLATDSSSTSTGSIITAGGVGVAKALYVGTTANIANLTFTGTGNRITGDMTNATQANRVAFQTSTANSATAITVIPNGTGTQSSINLFNNSDPTNAGSLNLLSTSAEKSVRAQITGTGTYLPITFYTGGSEAVRIGSGASSATDKGTVGIGYTSLTGVGNNGLAVLGNVGIGTTTPNSKMSVAVSSTSTSVLASYANIPLLLQNTSSTDNNWSVIAVQDAAGDFSSYIGTQNTSQASNTAIMAFATNGGSGATERMRIDSSGNVGIGNTVTSVLDAVGAARPLSVQKSDTNTTLNGSLAAITITNGDTTTNNTAQLNFAAITGASTNQYSSAVISAIFGARTNGQYPTGQLVFSTTTTLNAAPTEKMRIDSSGNVQVQAGAVMPYAPAPTGISAATTLTNANIQGQIISATGTTYTITMPLGTTMETLATWATTNIAYDFFVINTASGTVTMAANTGVTTLGTLTIATGVSAHFRIRRTAANTFVLYRLV
jgi:hypothetical protein